MPTQPSPTKALSSKPRALLTGLAFPESPRWHDGRLWFCDWCAHEIVAVDERGKRETILRVPFSTFPFSIDWLPDGRLLMVSTSDQPLLRREADGSLQRHADLSVVSGASANMNGWNEIVVDGRGNAYINGAAQLPSGGGFAPGIIALVTPDGAARQVADGIEFPNGIAVTPDNTTLIVAESFGRRLTAFDIAANGTLSNRRVWADLHDGAPDGICIDVEDAVWYADVPNKRCVRVREGGLVLQTILFDRGCFACMLGGAARTTLFVMANEWRGFASMGDGSRDGLALMVKVPMPGVGWP